MRVRYRVSFVILKSDLHDTCSQFHYKMMNLIKNPKSYLMAPHEGEVWGVFCDFKIRSASHNSPITVWLGRKNYHKVSNIRRTLEGYKIVDHSDVVGASPVGAAPTTSSFST